MSIDQRYNRESKVVCKICGKEAPAYFSAIDRNRNISKLIFVYYRCTACGFIFLEPVPKDLRKYYPTDYYGGIPASVDSLLSIVRKYEAYKIDMIKEIISGGRLLEIGPSMGGFAILAKMDSFAVQAIEMDENCCRFLNEIAGIPTVHALDEVGALESVDRVDVISMWQVIEHLSSPLELIRAARKKLLPGGIMVIAAPNPGAFQFRLLGGAWVHVDAPRHLCLVPIELLRKELQSLDMEILVETTKDKGSLAWNEFGWKYSFSNSLRGSIAKRIAENLGKLVTVLMKPIEQSGMRGSTYTLIARSRH